MELAKMDLNYLGFNCRKTPVALEIDCHKILTADNLSHSVRLRTTSILKTVVL